MVRTIEFRDPGRLELIKALEKGSKGSEASLWSVVADELSKVRRNRREVNLHRIDKYTQEGEVVIVPGKVLGDGVLSHKVEIAAYKFTAGAEKKIKEAGGKTMGILELMKKNPKASKIRLMG
jgi:large subunit ribosomal protein L18e